MFTMEEKRSVLAAIRYTSQHGTLHIVTHMSPDQDGMGASFLLMRKAKIQPFDQLRVKFHFVPNGEMLNFANFSPNEIPGRNDLVIHVDTGGKLNIDTTPEFSNGPIVLVFDHHFKGCPFASATRIVYELLFVAEGRTPPRYAQDLVRFIDRVDSGNEVETLDQEDYDAIKAANLLLKEHTTRPIGRFIAYQPGPSWLMPVIRNQLPDASDETHLRVLLYSLEASAYGAQKRYEITEKIREGKRTQVNGVNLTIIAENQHDPGDVRSILNREHHDEVDVLITETPPKSRYSDKGRFSIALLSQKGKIIEGMKEVAEELRLRFPDTTIYLHHKEFIIYIKSPTEITMTDVLLAIKENLRRKDPPDSNQETEVIANA